MADTSDGSRTEAPSQRKRDESRRKGRVAYSSDLGSGLALLGAMGYLRMSGQWLGQYLQQIMVHEFQSMSHIDFGNLQTSTFATSLLTHLFQSAGMLVLGLFCLNAISGGLQAGFLFAVEPLLPNWEKLNPINGAKRIFSLRAVVRGLQSLAKLLLVAAVVLWQLRSAGPMLQAASSGSLASCLTSGWNLAIDIGLAVALTLVILGISDYAYQWWQHEQELKMTRQEAKDERKQDEGDPHLKARLRKLQREVARGQMLRDVPKSTVVITNPTHYAVALQYERDSMEAPRVVAKGRDRWALRIMEIARQHGVEVVQNPPIARALYASLEVGQEITPAFYQAISEILAYVYRLRRAA
ncbi:MAG: flagellar biosynthesis protein FlhB [Pirellulaceae bacterium]|nr:flagellar biosynthesis protein FlhB [Planctomycetales bacterium]